MKKLLLLKSLLLLCALIVGTNAWADNASVNISTYASAHSWSNGTAYATININSDVTATGLTSGNNSKYYTTNSSWRHYEGDEGTITIETSNGVLNSVTFVYTGGNNGIVKDGTTTVDSNSAYEGVNGKSSTVFSVGHSSGSKNGNVQITSITVTYTPAEGTKYHVTYDANGATSGTVPTDANDYDKDASVTVKGNTGSLTKPHYSFGGWNTKADGTGTTYDKDDTFTITENTTLFAKWSLNKHNITMPIADTYGSYTASATDDVPYGTEITLTYTPALGYESYRTIWSVNGTPISGSTFEMPDEAVTITALVKYAPTITYDFSEISGFSSWSNSYSKQTVTYTDAEVVFASASKQSGTITDIPVTKGGDVTLKLENDGFIKFIKFVCRQWTDKAQTITLKYSTDGGSNFSLLSPSVTSTKFAIEKDNLPAGTNAVRISFSNSSNQVGIESAQIEVQVPVTIGESKYASYCSGHALDFSKISVKAYKAAYNSSTNKVGLSQVDKDEVPAGEGIILYGAEGNYTVPVIASASAVSDNELIGVTTRTLVEWETGGDGKKNYILQGGVFKKASSGNLKANRAYLHTSYDVTKAGAREYLEFAFEDDNETTGLSEITNTNLTNNTNEYYNLAGQRVAQPTKGLYIVNGKKVVIK